MQKITNTSGKLIVIGGLSLLPGATGSLPEDYEGNPVIRFFADTGRVKLGVDTYTPSPEKADAAEETDVEKVIARIREMKRAELDALAAELGVEVEETDTVPTLKEKLIAFCSQK